ncbi:MAG: cell division protein FtsW [Kordia sp.]|nr:MAG: cell division protein FtsW [Kordia sp.]
MQGTTIGGANASRWIRVPVVGFSFQTSTLASVVLMVYVARYLAKIKDKVITFKESAIELWTPVVLVLLLIFPANFSTAALIFSMVLVLVFLGGYPLKYIGVIIGSGMIFVLFFFITAKAFPDAFPNRVDTWISRIENFSNGEDTKDDYQIERAKTAIASGRLFGLGPGKSVQKNFLPQSSSDFIYAIIVEEWGLVVGVTILLFYLLLLFRLIVILNKSDTFFGKLLVVGVGLPIIFQALINMAVAVELFPVTGQTLPLISSGGTSIWMTCLAIGIILSVSSSQKKEKEKIRKRDNPLDVL